MERKRVHLFVGGKAALAISGGAFKQNPGRSLFREESQG